MISTIRRTIERFRPDTNGGAAVEFAIIAPVMLLMFFGAVEVSQGVAANRKMTLAARTISDLVARTGDIDQNELKNVFTASTYILRPFDLTDFKATVSAISMDGQGVPSVVWKVNLSWSNNAASLSNSSDKTVGTVPPDLRVAKTQLIKSDVTYPYKPASAFFIKTISMSSTFFARPRRDTGVVTCKTCS